jgi:NAD(P)-dependent dehydrogenase (short-subunit alcohol dehydrogenase family)
MAGRAQRIRLPRSARLLLASGVAYLGWRALRGAGESLAGQIVLISGGSRGLGFLLAQEFASLGCRIVICARDEVQLENARARLEEQGASVLAVPCDVARQEEVEAAVSRAVRHFGRVDVLVNNAGVIEVGPLESMTLDDFREAMDIMYWGSLYMTLAVLPGMRERRSGRIVNITSIGGKVAVPHLLPYDAAKFALVGLSQGLRAELKKDGILVSTIVPGLMRTGSPVNAFFKGDREKEFTWFALGSATPLTTMSARRAASRIVEATRRGEAEVTLTWQAKLLRLTHDVLPGPVADLMGLVNRWVLPEGHQAGRSRGMELDTALAPSPLTALMNRAAIENNEFGGRPRPSPEHAASIGLDWEREKGE